jgi:hypothetical protein
MAGRRAEMVRVRFLHASHARLGISMVASSWCMGTSWAIAAAIKSMDAQKGFTRMREKSAFAARRTWSTPTDDVN